MAATGDRPDWIGPFRVLDVLGEGGMGRVYLAERREPVRQRVAVKVIKLGMDTEAVIRRFELERQALAVMSHDSIAKVLDAGTTERGQPWFAMEYVRGVNLLEYCDRHRLTLPQRIGLFQQVCGAVQHAHQKGVIHRDLKPGNILVSDENGQPVAKVIDFGLARATDHLLLQQTLFTEFGHVIGTPEYMSPEQVEFVSADIDTRTDIYSLGVILYQLLTGEVPFDSQRLRAAGPLELQRMLREEEPLRPSSRLLRLGPELVAAIAERRQATPGGLERVLRRDLDWIVLKAMEKDRNRRYDSAAALAADLARYLEGEPVLACPPSTGYRLRKLVSRYRRQVVTAGLVLGTAVVGAIFAVAYAVQANAQQGRAQQLLSGFLVLARADAADRLIAEADELHPAWPERLPAMRDWLERADELRRFLPEVTAELERLRAPSAPDGAAAFDTTTARYLQQGLERLGARLRIELGDTGTYGSVQRRAAAAASAVDRSIAAHRSAWDRAIARVRERHGFELLPQTDLVPLGPDPVSGLEEFAHLPSGTIPRRGPDGTLDLQPDMAIVLVLLPGGPTHIGSSREPGRPNHSAYTKPDETLMEVDLQPFLIGKFESTQGQWLRLAGNNPSSYQSGREYVRVRYTDRHPVGNVSWLAAELVLWQAALTLPTEAQWEYACRAGTGTAFATGDDEASLQGHANVADRTAATMNWGSLTPSEVIEDGFVYDAPVGSFRANAFGLHDMHGNHWEWCLDAYAKPRQPHPVGQRPDQSPLIDRVYRGGSFRVHPLQQVCSAYREKAAASAAQLDYGVRAARLLQR